MECSQFHFEVLQKLHSMKSLEENQAADRPTSDEAEKMNVESSKQQSQFHYEADECAIDFDFNGLTPMNAMKTISKVIQRNQELEDALIIKEMAMQKLRAKNEELENELKRKEAVRLSQLELLALRNVELEKELHQQSSN
jgi:hypothetical protein